MNQCAFCSKDLNQQDFNDLQETFGTFLDDFLYTGQHQPYLLDQATAHFTWGSDEDNTITAIEAVVNFCPVSDILRICQPCAVTLAAPLLPQYYLTRQEQIQEQLECLSEQLQVTTSQLQGLQHV